MIDLLNQIKQATPGKGRDDDVPVMASENEFIIPADVVAILGDGNSEAGGKILQQFVDSTRAQSGGLQGIASQGTG
jgi:hypothetical protein